MAIAPMLPVASLPHRRRPRLSDHFGPWTAEALATAC
jgi:hypothetical protein